MDDSVPLSTKLSSSRKNRKRKRRSSTNHSSTTNSCNTTQINTLLRLHSKSILSNFIDEGQFYDIRFEVGTGISNKHQTFKGFKALFAVQSTKFHQILFDHHDDDDFKNDPSTLNANHTDSLIQITDLHPDTFSFLQKLFYQSFDITIDTHNVIGIMNAAKAYSIPHLRHCCFQYLLTIDFHVYSSSFFFLLHEIEHYYPENEHYVRFITLQKEHINVIIDRLQPIVDTSKFVQFFNQNNTLFSKLRSNTIIYLLFSARKFEKIPQEHKWKMCLFWAKHHENGNTISKRMQCYVEYFTFAEMDWTFFIQHVYDVLTDDELVKSILCGYIMHHSRIFSEHRGKMTVFTTKFTKFVESQKSFVSEVRSQKSWTFRGQFMSNANIIKELVRFVEFNIRSIEDKQKEPSLYDRMDAYCEKKWKITSFLNAEESMKTYSIKTTQKHVQIRIPPSRSVESLYPTLCDSIQNKLASIMFSSTLGDVKCCLRPNQS
eukprot:1014360_1